MKKLFLGFIILGISQVSLAEVYNCNVTDAKGEFSGATTATVYINLDLDVEINLPGASKSSVGLNGAEVKEASDNNIFVKRYGPDGEKRIFSLNNDGEGFIKLYDDTFFGLFGEMYAYAKLTNCSIPQ